MGFFAPDKHELRRNAKQTNTLDHVNLSLRLSLIAVTMFEMKRRLLFLGILTGLANAELPQMSEGSEWLGYFTGWEGRGWDYGFGADGEGLLFPKKGRQRRVHEVFRIYPRIQEQWSDKWHSRSTVDWSSDQGTSINPSKPVSATLEVKGESKAQFTQTYSGGKILIKPKLLETKTKNPVRLAVEIKVMDFERVKKKKDKLKEKDYKKMFKGERFEAVRSTDGKKVTFDLYEKHDDLMSPEKLADGASEISHKIKYIKKTLELEQGNPKVGKFEIKASGPLYEGYRVFWVIDPEMAKKSDAYLTIGLK